MVDFSLLILHWYARNKRDLPWRQTKDPYFIWLSEIILQQTRVDQGLKYYEKFVRNYPNIEALACASEQAVLADWQGLGYYSRARSLHATANYLVENNAAQFPETYAEIIKLKGIGPYTAAAISSFSFNEAQAVLDGNVFRVLSRLFDIDLPIDSPAGKKHFAELAQNLLPKKKSAMYNQAIMEFGALVCVPKSPDCLTCPLQSSCMAFHAKTVSSRPTKMNKVKIRSRYFNYFFFQHEGRILLEKREENDIWKHLYQLPLWEQDLVFQTDLNEVQEHMKQRFGRVSERALTLKKHVLSHQHIFSRVWLFDSYPKTKIEEQFVEVKSADLSDFAVPQLLKRFFDEQFPT